MSRTRRASLGRTGLLGLLGALILLISGDRGAFTAPGPDIGIDPLEILNLQIRANAIVVLDSSGSMAETLAAGDTGGDDPTSKMWLAKDVMRTFVAANERKVSFMFGQYEQPGIGTQPTTTMTLPTTGIGRFLYTTTSENGPAPVPVRAPSMLTNELRVDLRAPYAFTTAQSLLLRENNAATSTACPLPAGQPHLALAVEQALSNCLAGGNEYRVSINDANQYTIVRSAGTVNWLIRWADMTTTGTTQLRTALGTGGSGNMAATTTGTFTAPADPPVTGTSPALWLRRASNSDFVETGVTHYMMYASRFFNGQVIGVRPDGIPCTAPLPAVGTQGVGGDGSSLSFDTQPYVDLVAWNATCGTALTPAQTVRFSLSSVPRSGNFAGTTDDGEWRSWAGNTTCGGFEGLLPLQACTVQAQLGLFTPFLQNEVPINAGTRWPVGYTEDATGTITAQPSVGGMRAGGNTPIAETIKDVKDVFENGRPTATPPLPAMWPIIRTYGGGNGPFPKTFLIFLTDGDDTCESENGDACSGSACLTDDQKALRAAYRAQLLRQSVDTSTARRAEASSITTYVVAFGSGASANRTNWIAYGGSGMIGGPGPNQIPLATHPTVGTYWSRGPNGTELAACTTCRPASIATNAADLATALQSAIDQGQTVGVFSDQQSVTESIFELAYLANAALSPFEANRYDFSVPILLQSTFEMPSFQGRLRAFRRAASASVMEWDAGDRLQTRVGSQVGLVNRTFLELRGTTATSDSNVLNSDALIERRIYTTSRNGVFGATINDRIDASLTTTPPNRLTLWPTQSSVDPVKVGTTFPAGVLDVPLGIAATSTPPMTFANLQTTFGACTASTTGGPLPSDCTAATGRAVKESRQMILAYMAGAEPVKDGTTVVRNATGEILYRLRTWILAESTLAAPAAVGPPPDERTKFHVTEYQNFVKGPGGAALSMGFGLTEPPDATLPTVVDPEHQPVMSVVYHAANDMLHAFRAGPCNKGLGCYGSTPAELGGEELWGFVPYDLLGSLKDRMKPQGRTNHTYMLSTPVRLADIFVPGAFSRNVESTTVSSNDGAWRVMIFFGRGIGGKYLTALDVTAPAQFNRHSLRTTGPIPIWSRGNPDTQNGLPLGPLNNTLNTTDATAFRQMGQTWSIPAIGFVERAGNTTTRTPTGVEYAAYAGSGYGDNSGCPGDPCEGARFYTLDALTGDVIASFNVGNRAGQPSPFPNVISAGPAVFQSERVSYRPQGGINESSKEATAVYFNDIHGRVWKIDTNAPATAVMLGDVNDSGPTQHPLAVSPALLNYTDQVSAGGDGMEHPHVYVESGNDNRIFLPTDAVPTTPPFKAWGLVDRNDSVDLPGDGVIGPVKVLFTKDFPALYRGTTQAATAFDASGLGRVFIAGTRFNPPGTVNAPPPPPCRSSFDSILFALGAGSGNAAFDLNSGTDEYVEYRDEKVMSVQAVRGHVVVDRGLGAEIAPTPPPAVLISQPVPGSVFTGISVAENYAIVNRETAFRAQPTLCR